MPSILNITKHSYKITLNKKHNQNTKKLIQHKYFFLHITVKLRLYVILVLLSPSSFYIPTFF